MDDKLKLMHRLACAIIAGLQYDHGNDIVRHHHEVDGKQTIVIDGMQLAHDYGMDVDKPFSIDITIHSDASFDA